MVETRAYATSYTRAQTMGAIAALLFAFTSLALLVGTRMPAASTLRRKLVEMREAESPVDVLVVVALLAWFVLAPQVADDGWVRAREIAFADLGAFSNYYDAYGTNHPFTYWLEWLQRWITSSTSHLVFLRFPSLLALLLSWPLARWCLRTSLGRDEPAAARWALASSFLLGAFAWGMTLRPEPFICLLVLVSLAACLRFAVAPALTPLVVAGIAIALALSAHPSGITAVAPVLAASFFVSSWVLRAPHRVFTAGSVGLVSVALMLVLLSLDSDVGTRLSDSAQMQQQHFYAASQWWHEWYRYQGLLWIPGSTGVRRLSVAVLLLVVLAYATRRDRSGGLGRALPGRTLTLGLLLLALNPSKNVLNFGVVIAIGAVAAGAEIAALLGESRTGARFPIRPSAGIWLLVIAIGWALALRNPWAPLDLQHVSWQETLGRQDLLEVWNRFPLALLVLGAATWAKIGLRRHRSRTDIPWQVTAWAVPVALLPIIVLTTWTFVLDGARSSSWSPTRQYVQALVGRAGCGLGDEIADPRNTEPIDVPLSERLERPRTVTLVGPDIAPYFPCARLPRMSRGVVERPDVVIMTRDYARYLVGGQGPFRAPNDVYRYELASEVRLNDRLPEHLWVYLVPRRVPGAVLAPARRVDGGIDEASAREVVDASG